MTTHLYKWVLAVVCMISAWLASDVEMYAQTPSSDNSVVEGVVSDQSGAPLAGVAALVQGNTSVFAITDAEGMYRLEGVTLGSVIEFSCLGMIPVTVTWNGERRLDVTMEEESLELEATVVIGYGSVKKKDLTGSVGILDGESLQTSSTTLLSQRLQGMIPGLNVSRTGSMPGTSATLQIRGVTTMSDNSPLILIDGMPASSIDDVNSLDIDQCGFCIYIWSKGSSRRHSHHYQVGKRRRDCHQLQRRSFFPHSFRASGISRCARLYAYVQRNAVE